MTEEKRIISNEVNFKIGDVIIVNNEFTKYDIVTIKDILYSLNKNNFSFYVKSIYGNSHYHTSDELIIGKVVLKKGVELYE